MSDVIHQQGILGRDSDPVLDSDVIMTAAIIGHARTRLESGKNVKFDVEVKDAYNVALALNNQDFRATRNVVGCINRLLVAAGYKGSELCQVGVTPIWGAPDKQGNPINRIVGGTGDMDVHQSERYEPKLPTGVAKELYDVAVGKVDPKTGRVIVQVGYQGRGAYTGFIDGREGGQTALLSTYRHNVPLSGQGRRWHPTTTIGDMQIGPGPNQRTWGMIGDNSGQSHPPCPTATPPDPGGLKEQGMYFQGPSPTPGTDIVCYTHGMIQAIYNVEMWKLAQPTLAPGTPYEIAVGKETTKLASCIPCSFFMEATGYPASSTHLGRGESWGPLYPDDTLTKATTKATTKESIARTNSNTAWYNYCQKIIVAGLACLRAPNEEEMPLYLTEDHRVTVTRLVDYVGLLGSESRAYANLILDAVTVHDSELKRLGRTLVGA